MKYFKVELPFKPRTLIIGGIVLLVIVGIILAALYFTGYLTRCALPTLSPATQLDNHPSSWYLIHMVGMLPNCLGTFVVKAKIDDGSILTSAPLQVNTYLNPADTTSYMWIIVKLDDGTPDPNVSQVQLVIPPSNTVEVWLEDTKFGRETSHITFNGSGSIPHMGPAN
jgi:hypothetical protein